MRCPKDWKTRLYPEMAVLVIEVQDDILPVKMEDVQEFPVVVGRG
jgi:hypothetical protein